MTGVHSGQTRGHFVFTNFGGGFAPPPLFFVCGCVVLLCVYVSTAGGDSYGEWGVSTATPARTRTAANTHRWTRPTCFGGGGRELERGETPQHTRRTQQTVPVVAVEGGVL